MGRAREAIAVRSERTLVADVDKLGQIRRLAGFSQRGFVEHVRKRYLNGHGRSCFSLSTLKRMERGRPVLAEHMEAAAAALNIPLGAVLAPALRKSLGSLRPSTRVSKEQPPPSHDVEPALAIRMYCEERFREILIDQAHRVEHGELDEVLYWKMFWYQQHSQFHYWLDGILPSDYYRPWLVARYREYAMNQTLVDIEYRQAWAESTTWLDDGRFIDFMELVFQGQLERAMELYGPQSSSRVS